MTISTMRQIDRFVGIPLCWISGLVIRALRKPPSAHVRSILVIKFFGLGSILLISPALCALKDKFPDAKIVFLSFSTNGQLLDRLSAIDERWFIDSQTFGAFLSSLVVLVVRLITSRIDIVIDLEFFSKFSTLVGSLAMPGRHIGFILPTNWRSWNLTDAVPFKRDSHVSITFLNALAPLGIKATGATIPRLHAFGGRSLRFPAAGEEFLAGDLICVNPNAGPTSLDRRWEGARFSMLIDALYLQNTSAIFCLIGSEDERDYVEQIRDGLCYSRSHSFNLAGCLDFEDLITLFSRSRLLVTNDSGPMHVAAAIGLPTAALFGPESPELYGPLGNQSFNLYAGLPCSPCLNIYDAKVFRCPIRQKCMTDISVDQVIQACRSLLSVQRSQGQLIEVYG